MQQHAARILQQRGSVRSGPVFAGEMRGPGPVRFSGPPLAGRSRSGPVFRTSARGEVQVRSVLSDLRSRGGPVRSGFPDLQLQNTGPDLRPVLTEPRPFCS